MTFLYHRDQAGWRFSQDGETAIPLEAELEGSGHLAPDRFPVEISVVGHVQRDRRYFVLHKPNGRGEMRGAELSKTEYKDEYGYDPYAAAAQLLDFKRSGVARKLEGSRPWSAESNGYLAHAQKLFLDMPPMERARDYLSALPEGGPHQGYPHTCFVCSTDDIDRVRTNLGSEAGPLRGGPDPTKREAPVVQMDEQNRDAGLLRKEIAHLGREREALGRQVAVLTDSVAVRRKDAANLGEEVVALEERLGSARRDVAALEERIRDAMQEAATHGATLARTSEFRERGEWPVKKETQASYESEVALLNDRVSALQETFEQSRGETPRTLFRRRMSRWSWPAAVAILSLTALAVALTGNQELDEAAESATAAATSANTAASEATAAATSANTAASEVTAAATSANTAASEATAAATSANTAASGATAAAGSADTAASEVTAAAMSANTAASEATAAATSANTAASEATAAAESADTAASEATAAATSANTAASEATAAAGRAETAASEATAAAGSPLDAKEIGGTDEDDADTEEAGTTSQ